MSRIAIVDRAKLRVLDLDRRNAVDLGAMGDARLANRQPSWSPDGARIAWTAFDRRQLDSHAAVAIATPEGTRRTDHAAVFPPFYLAWRPDGAAVATLAEGPLGLELCVVDERSGVGEILHRGAPLYFAWSHDGALAVHRHAGATSTLSTHGAGYDGARFASLQPGSFRAPAFVGDQVAAVVEHAGRPHLVLLDRSATVTTVLAPAEHGANFVVSPSGEFVAATTFGTTPGPLVVHDMTRGTTHVVDPSAPALLQWSPDSSSLLVARVVDRGDFPRLAWSVWRDGEQRTIAEARTTASFAREVLPFYEQFAQSHSWWAPDGQSFCYAAVDDFGNDTIWVADVRHATATRIATGSIAVFAPR